MTTDKPSISLAEIERIEALLKAWVGTPVASPNFRLIDANLKLLLLQLAPSLLTAARAGIAGGGQREGVDRDGVGLPEGPAASVSECAGPIPASSPGIAEPHSAPVDRVEAALKAFTIAANKLDGRTLSDEEYAQRKIDDPKGHAELLTLIAAALAAAPPSRCKETE